MQREMQPKIYQHPSILCAVLDASIWYLRDNLDMSRNGGCGSSKMDYRKREIDLYSSKHTVLSIMGQSTFLIS